MNRRLLLYDTSGRPLLRIWLRMPFHDVRAIYNNPISTNIN